MTRALRTLLLSAIALGALATAAIAAPGPLPMSGGASGGMTSMHATGITQMHTASGGMTQMHAEMMGNWAPWWYWLSIGGVWIVGIAVIVWAVTALFPNQPRRDPQQILDERLARGEISLDEYRQRRDELAAHARPTDRPGA